MKKLFSSNIIFALSIVIFLACSYWIYKNVTLEDLVGKTSSVEVVPDGDIEDSEISTKDLDIVKADSSD